MGPGLENLKDVGGSDVIFCLYPTNFMSFFSLAIFAGF